MGINFHFLPRGSYTVGGTPEQVADKVAEYCTNKEQQGLRRKLDLTFEPHAKAVRHLQIPEGNVKGSYIVETEFIDEKRERASELLGNPRTIQAVVIGYKGRIDSEVIPFNLKIRDEDIE